MGTWQWYSYNLKKQNNQYFWNFLLSAMYQLLLKQLLNIYIYAFVFQNLYLKSQILQEQKKLRISKPGPDMYKCTCLYHLKFTFFLNKSF